MQRFVRTQIRIQAMVVLAALACAARGEVALCRVSGDGVKFEIATPAATQKSSAARSPEIPPAMQAADPWMPFRFLVGDWVGVEGSGKPGEAISGGSSFAFDLGNTALVRRNRADYPPKPGEKAGISHQDLLIIYRPLGETQYRAFYVDNEGHAINYLVSSPANGTVVFESDAAQKGPRYRLEYRLNPDRTLAITFSMAPPGGDFQVYTTGSARK